MSTAPGWYHADGDPPGTHRYWDGAQWTTDAQPIAQPQGAAPQAATPAPGAGGQFGTKNRVQGSHEVDYEIFGDDMQFVEVELDPGETVIGEAGAMMYMEDGISFETKMGDGSEPDQGLFKKLGGAAKRAISGESIFLTHFTHQGHGKAKVAFAAPYPGSVLAVDLEDVGGRLIVQKDGFLAAAYGTKIDIAFNRKLGAGFFGGEGFILQDLQGDGNVFIHAGGTVVERTLTNSTLRIDTGCIVAMESTIQYNIERAGSLKSSFFGGEGLFLATLSGTGRVWLQSLPFERLASRVARSVATGGGGGDQSGFSINLGG